MIPNNSTVTPEEFWRRMRGAFTERYLGFREEAAIPPTGRPRGRPGPPSVVGAWGGRTWQVGFLEPRTFYPEMQVGFTTAARLVEPARMPSEHVPWLFAGQRPGVFTKNAFDFDRIVLRYRRREGNFKGTLTGDPDLDRRWGIYPYEETLGPVFREPKVLDVLRSAERLSPNPKKSLPTLAVFGTEATFTLPVSSTLDRVPGSMGALEGFGHVLDRLEEARGSRPASQVPLPMDLLRDDLGVPFPVPRLDCPWCQQSTHPRYQSNLETEVCEKCGKILYLFR